MSASKYSLLAKEEHSDEDERDFGTLKAKFRNQKLKSTCRDFLLIILGFFCAFGILKSMNWNEIEDNFYHDVLELEDFHNDKLNYKSHESNDSLAHKLFNEVKVLCIVTTTPENHIKRAIHVKRTWGKRCNKLIFASTKEDKSLGAIKLNVKADRSGLWDKTKEALKYVHDHELEKYDWFMKADDDTYVILENLRYFLYSYSPDFPIAFGCKLHLEDKDSYFSGGAGYVLSRRALSDVVVNGLRHPNHPQCNLKSSEEEDVEMGFCIKKLNIMAGDSRDDEKRGKFHPLSPASTLIPVGKIDDWYPESIFYKFAMGLNCCSDYSITFHYIKPKELYALEFLLYHLKKPFGIPTTDEELPKKMSWSEIVEKNKLYLNETTD